MLSGMSQCPIISTAIGFNSFMHYSYMLSDIWWCLIIAYSTAIGFNSFMHCSHMLSARWCSAIPYSCMFCNNRVSFFQVLLSHAFWHLFVLPFTSLWKLIIFPLEGLLRKFFIIQWKKFFVTEAPSKHIPIIILLWKYKSCHIIQSIW